MLYAQFQLFNVNLNETIIETLSEPQLRNINPERKWYVEVLRLVSYVQSFIWGSPFELS